MKLELISIFDKQMLI